MILFYYFFYIEFSNEDNTFDLMLQRPYSLVGWDFASLFLSPSLLSSLTVFLAFVFIQLVALTRNGWCNSFSTREIILYTLWSWTRKAKNKAKNKRQAYKQQHLSRQEIDEANFIQRNKSYVIPRGISPRKLYLT